MNFMSSIAKEFAEMYKKVSEQKVYKGVFQELYKKVNVEKW